MEKAEIRKKIKQILQAADPEVLLQKSRIIQGFVLLHEDFINAQSVFVYLSVKGEVESYGLIQAAMGQGKKVYIPKITGGKMLMTLLSEDTLLTEGAFGIPEDNNSTAVYEKVDLVIAPLAAYDDNFNRLGKGKGYYDRFLSENPAPVMALAFTEQRADFIPAQPHDIKMDYIATEKGIIKRCV